MRSVQGHGGDAQAEAEAVVAHWVGQEVDGG